MSVDITVDELHRIIREAVADAIHEMKFIRIVFVRHPTGSRIEREQKTVYWLEEVPTDPLPQRIRTTDDELVISNLQWDQNYQCYICHLGNATIERCRGWSETFPIKKED